MARRGEEASAEQPRPESVWPRKILHRKAEIEIKNLQFARWRRYSHHVWPATWNLVEDDKETDDRPPNIQCHLDHVGPDHGRHAALEGIEEGERHNQQDRRDFRHVEHNRD